MIDKVEPLLALAPVRKHRIDSVPIVDGTLVPTPGDHRSATPSKNYRYSTNVQITIDARLVIPTGDPQPDNRNVYRDSGLKDQLADRRVITDGGYCGNPEVIIPYRRAAHTLADIVSGITHLHNITLAG